MLPLKGLSVKALVFQHILIFLLPHIFQGLSQGVSKSPPVVALVGEDVILPCHLEPAADAVSMILEWGRPELKPRFVHLWHEGQNLLDNQNPSYKGRTSLSTDKLKHGDLSLTLLRVKLSDSGTYRCYVPKINRESTVELIVGSVSTPVIVEINISGDKDVLQCESKGWNPPPEVLWLDGEGHLLSAGPTETVQGPDELFSVSSRLTVNERHDNSFTCRVHQRNINQTRETHIQISAECSTSLSNSAARIIVVLVASCLCISVIGFFLWKRRQPTADLKEDNKRTDQGEKLLGETMNNGPNQGENILEEQKNILETLEEHKKNLGDLIQELKDQEKKMKENIEQTEKKLEVAKNVGEHNKEKGYFELMDVILLAKTKLQERRQGDSRFVLNTQKLFDKTNQLHSDLKTKMTQRDGSGDPN